MTEASSAKKVRQGEMRSPGPSWHFKNKEGTVGLTSSWHSRDHDYSRPMLHLRRTESKGDKVILEMRGMQKEVSSCKETLIKMLERMKEMEKKQD